MDSSEWRVDRKTNRRITKDNPQFIEKTIHYPLITNHFDLSGVLFREKNNFACRIADLVLQAVNDNKLRHETLQRFMLANDSVTVACEVPVYIDSMDIEHMVNELALSFLLILPG